MTKPVWVTWIIVKTAWDWYLEATEIIDSEREREVVENSDTILIFVSTPSHMFFFASLTPLRLGYSLRSSAPFSLKLWAA